ncbi:MAG: DNA-binding protein WhiA [Firmicutes bacterium]|nr:DNA-binding protein WhiA [Bacillota bacterium]
MSFSSEAKAEAAATDIGGEAECRAELSALIRTCGQLSVENKKLSLVLVTEIEQLFSRVEKLAGVLYANECKLSFSKEERPNKAVRYNVGFSPDVTKQVLADCFVIRLDTDGSFEQYQGISRHLFSTTDCSKHFIIGAFIGCASANIVIKDINNLSKHTGGYHLEFVFNNGTLASDFGHVLSEFGLYSKTMRRKNLYVVYIKEAELVSDVLALVGANNAVLTLQNEFAVREVRNKLNRQLNCMNANLTKMVEASLKQLESIEYINSTVGIEALPENLYELCMLRLANPEETLDNLAKLMTPALTKSGINHRLRKINKIAEGIRKKGGVL